MKIAKLAVLVLTAGLVMGLTGQAQCRQELRKGRAFRSGETAVSPRDEKQAEEEYFKFLRENSPDEAEELIAYLKNLRENNPAVYKKAVGKGYGKMRHLKGMKEKEPKRFKSNVQMMRQEIECVKLSKAYRQAETVEEKEKIKAELRQTLNGLFEKREAEKEIRVKRLEEVISKLKAHNEERKKKKNEIIEKRLGQLTSDAKLEW